MRLGFATMPVHPVTRDWRQTLREDQDAVILADKLGYFDAFVGEHLADRAETITNSFMFLASLISLTHNIKLATGTSNLSHTHPVLVAAHAAMFDHLANGRFIFGISPGALAADAEALGILGEDRTRIFEEAIDVILEIWSRDPPYDIDLPNNRFKVSTGRTSFTDVGVGYLSKPLQRPRPEIVGTVVAPFSKGVVAMGRRDFHPLSAHFLLARWLKSHWDNYADDDRVAERYGGTDEASPYRFFYKQLAAKLTRSGRQGVFKTYRDQPESEITLDYIVDNLVIRGSVSKVVDQLLALRNQTGDFGELVYASVDWTDPVLARRSMELMATEVLPRVNAAIGQQAASEKASAAD
jgi:alkanesulfonate monooxygenase SsuD/methylene tetrahydromethanopterin reductase-like flavin-dependent oxidoreductase (luciferase family)